MRKGWPETRPGDLKSFVSEIAECSMQKIAWRGMARQEWPLLSSLQRHEQDVTKEYTVRLCAERFLLQSFRDRAVDKCSALEQQYLGETFECPLARINLMAIARHYGVPTRAIDWTHSAMAALYCASREHPDADGALWWIDEQDFENYLGSMWDEWGVPLLLNTNKNKTYRNWQPYLFDPSSTIEFVTKVHFPIPFPRMEAQRAFLMMSSHLRMSYDEWIGALPNDVKRGRIIVLKELKAQLMKWLARMGIHAQSLHYPELDLIGSSIAQSPHDQPQR